MKKFFLLFFAAVAAFTFQVQAEAPEDLLAEVDDQEMMADPLDMTEDQFDPQEIAAQTNGKTMQQPAPAAAPTPANPPMPNCAALPPDQQAFAMQLSPSNQMVFCNAFTPAMRSSAMQMMGKPMGKPAPAGSKMTPDQCVEQVAKTNNIMIPPATPQPAKPPAQTGPQKGSGGGCPIR